MQTIQVNGKEVKYCLRQGSSGKYVTFKFPSEGRLEIILPKNLKVDVESLLKQNSSLIERKYLEAVSRQKIQDGNTLLYKGKKYQVEVLRKKKLQENRVVIKNNIIQVTVGERENVASVLKNWMSNETRQYVTEVESRCSENFKTKPINVSVVDTKRWGYCTRRKSVFLNWQLIALPPEIAEYVVLHEYMHLSEFNHQKKFHSLLANLCPDYRKREKELRKFVPVERFSFPNQLSPEYLEIYQKFSQ